MYTMRRDSGEQRKHKKTKSMWYGTLIRRCLHCWICDRVKLQTRNLLLMPDQPSFREINEMIVKMLDSRYLTSRNIEITMQNLAKIFHLPCLVGSQYLWRLCTDSNQAYAYLAITHTGTRSDISVPDGRQSSKENKYCSECTWRRN